MVERHFLRGMIASNGQYACEYCDYSGKTRVGGTYWPYPECKEGNERTHESFREIAE